MCKLKNEKRWGFYMSKLGIQITFGVILAVFFVILIALTIVYIKRRSGKSSSSRKDRHPDIPDDKEDTQDKEKESKGYWINRDDLQDADESYILRYYHYFDNIDQCINDLVVEMYDCGFVKTEEIFVIAYGRDALTPDSYIYMTDADGDLDKARAALPPVSEKNQKLIYDKWCSYVDRLFETVEVHTSPENQAIIKDALMVYGRKKTSILLKSPD
jgi:hypothetical protein